MTGNVADRPHAEHQVAEQQAGRLPARPAPHQDKPLLTRRGFLRGSAIAAASLALYSAEIARHEIAVLTHTVGIRNLPTAFHNLRVAQISDIHFDEYTEPAFLERVVRHVNSLQPGLVLLTGDFISIGPLGKAFAFKAVHHCLEILRGLEAPHFACMGNHDSIIGAPILKPIFQGYGTPMLMNAGLPLERGGDRLWLCGVGEYLTETADLFRTIPPNPGAPVLLMAHSPDYADTVVAHPRGPLVDLMLSGHTHGGQVRVPFLGPMHLPEGGRKYVEGFFHLDRMQLYVNKGIGTVGLPLRLNCPPEIALFTLQPA
jgi:predicted MPP superfamily phosphohydrolase